MDIPFFEPEQMPQPRENIKVETLDAEAYPDGRRVRVTVKMTPFSERPSLVIEALNTVGDVLAQVDVLEAMTKQVSLTLHLRGPLPEPQATVRAQLYFEGSPPQHIREVTIALPDGSAPDDDFATLSDE